MQKVRLFLGFGALLIFLLAPAAMAAPNVVNKPAQSPPNKKVTITGADFAAYEGVDIFFDSDDLFLAVTDNLGQFSATLKVPASAAPGTHWITAIGRRSGWAAQKRLLVRTEWLQYRYSPRRTGHNPHENVLGPDTIGNLQFAWAKDTGDGIECSPAVAKGKVYVGNYWGKVFAFNAVTGKKISGWPVKASGTILSSPTVYDGRVYVGDNAGELHAFKVKTGAVPSGWPVVIGSPIQSSPTVVRNRIYVGSSNGKVYAFNRRTGKLKSGWPASTGGPITSSPAVANGRVYVGSEDKKLYAFNAVTGVKLWDSGDTITDAIDFSSPAVGPDGMVYVGSRDRKLYAFEGATGTKLWDSGANINSQIRSSPALAKNRVYVGGMDGKLYAFNASTGALLPGWPVTAGGSIYSAPAVANGVVYVGCADGRLYAFDAVTGSLLWQWNTGVMILRSSPVVVDGMVYIGARPVESTPNGWLYAFKLEEAAEMLSAQSRRVPAGPPAPADLVPDYRLNPQR